MVHGNRNLYIYCKLSFTPKFIIQYDTVHTTRSSHPILHIYIPLKLKRNHPSTYQIPQLPKNSHPEMFIPLKYLINPENSHPLRNQHGRLPSEMIITKFLSILPILYGFLLYLFVCFQF